MKDCRLEYLPSSHRMFCLEHMCDEEYCLRAELVRLKDQSEVDIAVMGEISKARDEAFFMVDEFRKHLEYLSHPDGSMHDVGAFVRYAREALEKLGSKNPGECICPTCGLRHGDTSGPKAEF